MLLQHSGERYLANALTRTRRRQAPPQVECPRRRDVVVNRVEELRIVAPELLPHLIRQAHAFPRQFLIQARPLAQFDDRRVGRLEPSQTVRVGTQRRGQHPRVPPVVFRARWRKAITEAVKLLGIDRVDGEAVLQQALDNRPAGRLDRHADFARVARRERQQPVRHLRQARTTMLELPFPELLPGGIKHARLMFLRSPVDTREPLQLQFQPPSRLSNRTGAPPMPAGPCTGAPRRKLPTGHPSVAGPPGHRSLSGASAPGYHWCSRRPARLHEITRVKSLGMYRAITATRRWWRSTR